MSQLATSKTSESVPQSQRLRKVLVPFLVLLAAIAAVVFSMMIPAQAGAPVVQVDVVKAFPHDPTAFCQGLAFYDTQLMEGTGQRGFSRLRKVNLANGKSVAEVKLRDSVFGEGITVWNNQVLQLTWQSGHMIVYDAESLRQTGTVSYRRMDSRMREGWGITHDQKNLIISDGSSTLRFVDPESFRLRKRLRVRDGRRSVSRLNELEYVNGEILANIWYSTRIARIDPESGQVTSWLELRDLIPLQVRNNREAVLNGIAFEQASDALYVTGKHWPSLFQIRY